MKFDQSAQKASVDQAEYTKALIDKLGEQNMYWRMTLDLLARKDLEKPLVIPNTIIANGDITVPDGIVAIRATSNQTAAVTLTANGNIPIPVSSAYGAQQVVTGRLVSLGVSGLDTGNTVWVQMLNERAAKYTASGAGVVGLGTDGNPAQVELSGRLALLPTQDIVIVNDPSSPTSIAAGATYYSSDYSSLGYRNAGATNHIPSGETVSYNWALINLYANGNIFNSINHTDQTASDDLGPISPVGLQTTVSITNNSTTVAMTFDYLELFLT